MRTRTIPALAALLLAGCLTGAAGCVTGAATSRGPGERVEEVEGGVDHRGEPPPPPGASGPPLDHSQLHRYSTRSLPGGLTCLIRLKSLGIPHVHLKRLRGVDTPVRITGPVGGLSYRSLGRRTLAGDCRLALALHRAAPYLRNLGVTELHFSNAYSYRMMPGGRPSRHAMGLAIDIHRVKVGDELLTLEDDYTLGEGDSCTGDSPVLNRVACLLQEKGLFDRVLTPDFDKAHYNHFHLAILSMHRRRRPPRDGRLQADAD